MKKIILALAVLAAVVCPVFAGESWIGVTTGPAFEMSNADELKMFNDGNSFVTDFNWDVNVEGAYYFNETETIGIGAKLGMGFNYGTTADKDYLKLVTGNEKNPMAGMKIAPAVTFQYRLGLTNALDLRMGVGAQYIYTIGNKVEQNTPFGKVSAIEMTFHNLEIIGSTDIVYSIGDFQVFGGIDLGVTVMCYGTTKMLDDVASAQAGSAKYTTNGDFYTDGFQMSITPRIGVSYAF